MNLLPSNRMISSFQSLGKGFTVGLGITSFRPDLGQAAVGDELDGTPPNHCGVSCRVNAGGMVSRRYSIPAGCLQIICVLRFSCGIPQVWGFDLDLG